MTFELRLLATILISLMLMALRQLNRIRTKWPKAPLVLPACGLVVWMLSALPIGDTWLISQMMLSTVGHIALSYATLRVGSWVLIEVPGTLGIWHPPPKIVRDLGQLILASILTIVILQQAGVKLVGLITTSALLTGALAFAAQEPLKDIFGGVSLQVDRAFKEGDWVQIGDESGTVIGLSLMNTYLRNNVDGCTLIIPNDTVAQSTIRRMQTGHPYGNYFEVGLDYGFPPSQAVGLLLRVVKSHASVLTKPPAKAWVTSFDDSRISYGIQVWHKDFGDIERKRIRGELLEQIWYALERIGQSIPFLVRMGSPNQQILAKDDPMCADNQHKINWLASNALFTDLNQEQLESLATNTRCVRFAKGEAVVRQGEIGDCLYQVITGMLEVSQTTKQGQMQTITKLGVNEIFGEMALCSNQPRNATVRALKESVLLEVERRDLQLLIDQDQTLLEKLARLIHLRQIELGELNKGKRESNNLSINRLIRSMRRLYNVFLGN